MKYHIEFNLELKKNPYDGLYIAVEGSDASGKTTQVKKLAEYFKSKGKDVILTREPRKEGLIGDLVQKILHGKEKVPPVSIQYLFSADRSINHEEVVIPALKKGKVVLSDRCFWSAVVYGILDKTGGKFDREVGEYLLLSQSILSMYHQFTVPDYTFYLKVTLAESLARLRKKTEVKEIYEDEDKIKPAIDGYEYLLERFPEELVEIDGGKSVQDVTNAMISKIRS